MRQILLVEDSKMFGRLAKQKIESSFDLPVFWAKSYAETVELLKASKGSFSMALLDYNLPDAPNGEVIDLVTSKGISSFVFTTSLSDEIREYVWSRKVADYILKNDPNSLGYVIRAMSQLEDNRETLILLVDDTSTDRTALSELLYVRHYRVLNATDGKSALEILKQYPEIKLVITDFDMPGMDGCMLCQKIRENFSREQMAIIGISSESDRNIAARFIQSGADDFFEKETFLVEEFYCRVSRSLETVDLFTKLREQTMRDIHTGLYSRSCFFDAGNALFEQCKAGEANLNCAILDIDHFRNVNDTYGHDVGDQVIKGVATILKKDAREGEIVARYGGDEFSMWIKNMNSAEMLERFEHLRQQIACTPAAFLEDGEPLVVTVSIGLCLSINQDMDTMTKVADEQLSQAKTGGRNRVCY